jgi:hypothetical protein
MNDFGNLASGIVTYAFSEDIGRFPLSYVSGWLETNLGELNGLTHEEFYIDDSGNIGPSGLLPVEQNIYRSLFEIHYYGKLAREVLRGVVYSNSGSLLTLKEGDTTIQFQNKNSLASSLREYGKDSQMRLDSLIGQYNYQKSSPLQVAGDDGLNHFVE